MKNLFKKLFGKKEKLPVPDLCFKFDKSSRFYKMKPVSEKSIQWIQNTSYSNEDWRNWIVIPYLEFMAHVRASKNGFFKIQIGEHEENPGLIDIYCNSHKISGHDIMKGVTDAGIKWIEDLQTPMYDEWAVVENKNFFIVQTALDKKGLTLLIE